MAYQLKTPNGKAVRVDGLPLGTLGKIAKDHELPSWTLLVNAPAFNAPAFIDLYAVCCAEAGCDPLPATPKLVVEIVEECDDERPTMYGDGLPKAEADPETT